MSRDESVGVTAGDSSIGGRVVASTELGSSRDDVCVGISLHDVVPDLVMVVVVDVGDPW